MSTYFVIAIVISLLSLISLILLRHAPARARFYICIFALVCWLIPWPYLQITPDIHALVLPFNPVFELTTLIPEVAEVVVTPLTVPNQFTDDFSWLRIEHVIQWFWPITLFIGMLLFARNALSYYQLQRQWYRQSTPCNELWQQVGLTRPSYNIRSLQNCGPGMATGLRNPTIWVNQQQQDPNTLQVILLHELTHIRQHDPVWLCVLNLMKCLFWWNPIMARLCTYAAKQIELSCDEQCQKHLPKGHYQQHLIELTLWANKQRNRLPTLAEKNMPMILQISSAKAFTLQRIQHLNKETTMKNRYRFVFAALLMSAASIAWSNVDVSEEQPQEQLATEDKVVQVFNLVGQEKLSEANVLLAEMRTNIESFSLRQQFKIWELSGLHLFQQENDNLDVLDYLDNALALRGQVSPQELAKVFRMACMFAMHQKQYERHVACVEDWKAQGNELPDESEYQVAISYHLLGSYDLSAQALESLINKIKLKGESAKDNWYNLLVGNYSIMQEHTKAYELQKYVTEIYPTEKNQQYLDALSKFTS